MGGKHSRRDRQIVRVLWLLKALGEGAQVSVAELARRFGTRRETIYRDLRTLEDIGYPIQGDESGRLSRPRLLDGRRALKPELRLTPDEYSALVSLIETNRHASPFRRQLSAASAKLSAMQAFPSEGNGALATVISSSRFGAKRLPSDEVIGNLVKAILAKHRCVVRYRSPKHKADKTFEYEPYRLRSVVSGLYCLGRISPFDSLATLATERIRSLEIAATTFVMDPDIDLDRYESEAFGVTLDDPIEVVVRVRADQAAYVSEREWHPRQKIEQLPDGGIQLTFCAGGTFEIERWILGWGDAMEVIAPESLRRSMRLKCRAMWNLYTASKHENRGKTLSKSRRNTVLLR